MFKENITPFPEVSFRVEFERNNMNNYEMIIRSEKLFFHDEFKQVNIDEIKHYINRFKQFKRTNHYKISKKAKQLFDVFFETQALLIWDGETLYGLRLVESHYHYTGKELGWWPLTSDKFIYLKLKSDKNINSHLTQIGEIL